METTKTQVQQASTKAAIGPTTEKVNPSPEQQVGPARLQPMRSLLPSPNGSLSTARAASVMGFPGKVSNVPKRARMSAAVQRQVGNARMARMLGGSQAKISVSAPGDQYGREADEAATRVVSGHTVARIARIGAGGFAPPVSRQEEEKIATASRESRTEEMKKRPDEARSVQRQAGSSAGGEIDSADMEGRLKAPSAGRPLPEGIRTETESGLGADFSGVRVHDTAEARGVAQSVNAKAFAYREHVWLGPGGSAGDRKLMAHELTHVVQHRGNRPLAQDPGLRATEQDRERTPRQVAKHKTERAEVETTEATYQGLASAQREVNSQVPGGATRAYEEKGHLNFLSMIGNQAVQRLRIARQEVADAGASSTIVDEPLSPGQVVRALSYYAKRAKQYTPDIIMQIQVAVGTAPTGRMTPVDVQAVARKQQEVNVNAEPKLKIDGMAGPRTLPSVFKFGLSEEESISEYTEKVKEKWNNRGGKSEEEIARDIVNELINERFKELRIPPLNVAITKDLGSRGTFRSSTWTMSLGARQFRPNDEFHDLRATTTTIYHEARHAEHDFRIAQMLARKGNDAAQINARTGLELTVAERAVSVKDDLTPMQALIAEHWFDSLHGGAGIEARRRNNAKLRVRFAARKRACEIFKRNPTPRNRERLKRAKDAYGRAVAEHDDLPHEFDPERLEHRVKQLFGDTDRPDDPCRSV